MKYASTCLLLVVFLFLPHGACRGGEEEGFACITDQDCPPSPCRCRSPAEMELRGVCATDEGGVGIAVCGGSCDRETICPERTSCQEERIEEEAHLADDVLYDVLVFSCLSDGTGGSGGTGGGGGTRGVFERCQESTMVYCNNGYACQGTWAVSPDIFEQLYDQSRQECLDTGSCPTTEEEECNEGGTYNAPNHEAGTSGQKPSTGEVEDVGGIITPVFPANCDKIALQ